MDTHLRRSALSARARRVLDHADYLRYPGLLGLLGYALPALAPVRPLVLLFLVPLAADLLRALLPAERGPPAAEPRLPAAAGSPARFALRLAASDVLSLLNPWLLAGGLGQAGGELLARLRTRGRLPTAGSYVQRVRYSLPFGGRWLVSAGGTTRETSHSWEILSQRYAYDFVRVDDAGRTHRGEGRECGDYLAYGEPILAPAPGVVASVRDGVRDAPRPGTGWLDWRTTDARGNYVVIRHDAGEYSLLAHLLPGSVRVRPGQPVARGEAVARCGNSGRSTEPHLHFQVQDHPGFRRAVGLPVRFSDLAVEGAVPVPAEPGFLERGARVLALRRPDPGAGPDAVPA